MKLWRKVGKVPIKGGGISVMMGSCGRWLEKFGIVWNNGVKYVNRLS